MRIRSQQQQIDRGRAADWRRPWRCTLLGLAGFLALAVCVGGASAERPGLMQDADSRQDQAQSGPSALLDVAGEPIRDLVDETNQLRTEVAAQSALLKQLLSGLERLIPSDVAIDPALGLEPDAGATCRRQLNELNARLQQQQLTLTEAQRRAEKAEKLAAAMDEAQAHANTEIERLSAELAMAKARQAESLQHAVELERRLATAEARLARPGTGDLGAGSPLDAGSAPATPNTAEALTQAATASLSPSPDRPASTPAPAPVLYEVRTADSLSRISERVYGDASAWERIYAANRDLLTTPDALSPGMSLVIP